MFLLGPVTKGVAVLLEFLISFLSEVGIGSLRPNVFGQSAIENRHEHFSCSGNILKPCNTINLRSCLNRCFLNEYTVSKDIKLTGRLFQGFGTGKYGLPKS